MRDRDFSGVAVGTLVRVDGSGGYREFSLCKVERVTATQLIIGTSRYWKKNGHRVGDSGWRTEYLSIATPEDIDETKRRQALRVIRDVKRDAVAHVSTDELVRIAGVLRGAAGDTPPADGPVGTPTGGRDDA